MPWKECSPMSELVKFIAENEERGTISSPPPLFVLRLQLVQNLHRPLRRQVMDSKVQRPFDGLSGIVSRDAAFNCRALRVSRRTRPVARRLVEGKSSACMAVTSHGSTLPVERECEMEPLPSASPGSARRTRAPGYLYSHFFRRKIVSIEIPTKTQIPQNAG